MQDLFEPNWELYPNFSRPEFVCKCGCGQAFVRPQLLEVLQDMRWALAEPLYISSGYRCADYNTTVSTTGPVGPHVQGLAADIRCFGGKAHRVLSAALSFGVPRIGVSQKGSASGRFLHVDLLESELSPWIWSY